MGGWVVSRQVPHSVYRTRVGTVAIVGWHGLELPWVVGGVGVVVGGCWHGLVLPAVGDWVVVVARRTKAVGAVLLNRIHTVAFDKPTAGVLGMRHAFLEARLTNWHLGYN